MKDVILFGASTLGQAAYLILKNEYNIRYFCDNDKEKWGKKFHNTEIIAPKNLKNIENLKIIITSQFSKEIASQLESMGIKNYSVFRSQLSDPKTLNITDFPYVHELYSGISKKWFPIFVKYPINVKPRYGYNGKGPHKHLHKIIKRNDEVYNSYLSRFREYINNFSQINKTEASDSYKPYWDNPWFTGLDAVALYSFIVIKKPKIYLEIGSGNSTKFARKAIKDYNLKTKIISIDPHPRAQIDSLADEVIRKPLEEVNIEVFNRLTENDILFFDGSHHCFMNSDVTVFFLDILPQITTGVFIQIHDIHLPYDYPLIRANHYESEQYLLATLLLGGSKYYNIVLPNVYLNREEEFNSSFNYLSKFGNMPKKGTSFWMEKIKGERL